MKMPTVSLYTTIKSLMFASLALAGAARADVVIMKPGPGETEGKTYDKAKVLSETADSITFEYIVVGNIKDTRTEPKANVAQVIRQKPEEIEIVKVREVAKVPDLTSADRYESIIQDQLRPFVNKYPGTPQAKEVDGLIAALQEEKDKVVSGHVKMEGKWLNPEEAKRAAREIDAFKVRREMLNHVAEGKWKEALNQWEKMKDREDGFMDTMQFLLAVPEAKSALEKYKAVLENLMKEQPLLVQRRQNALKSLVDPDLSRAKLAFEREDNAFKSTIDIEKRTRVKWQSTYKYDLKSIQDALKAVATEVAYITVLDTDKIKTQNEAIAAARRYLADGNLEQAEAAIARAQAVNLKDSSRVLQKVKTEASTLRTELNKKKANQRLYGGGASLPSGFGAKPGTDDRVAQAMADAEKKTSDAAESGTGVTTSSLQTAEKNGVEAPEAEAPAPPRRKRVEAVEENNMQKYLMYGGGGLLAILLIAFALQKKR
jgi:tetratricopeptide (TPR) repeat protein